MLVSSTIIKKVPIVKKFFGKINETPSLPQANGIYNRFNTIHRLASLVGFSLTVIVACGRIYGSD
jgi:hypothetical protein